jgi:hypothetical protein
MTTARFAPRPDALRAADDRRLAIAVGASLVLHTLFIAALRSPTPTVQVYSQGGVSAIVALQAVLAGPVFDPPKEELILPDPMLDTALLAPALLKPVEITFGRSQPRTAPVVGGGPTVSGATTPDISVAVKTISDPSLLGSRYVTDFAQRFPTRATKEPAMVGSPVVVYPHAALEQGIEGHFAVMLTLDAAGKITSSELVVDDALFGPVMLDALNSVRFTPADVYGKQVPYWTIVEFIFTIGRPVAPPVAASAPARGRAVYPRQPSVGR